MDTNKYIIQYGNEIARISLTLEQYHLISWLKNNKVFKDNFNITAVDELEDLTDDLVCSK